MSYRQKFYDLDKLFLFSVMFFFVAYSFYLAFDAMIPFYGACIFMSISSGYNAINAMFKRRLNIGALLSTQTVLWYALPFSYIWIFGYSNYISLVSEGQAADGLCYLVVLATFSYLIFTFFFDSWKLEFDIFRSSARFIPLIGPIIVLQALFIAIGRRGYAMVLGEQGASKPLIYQFVEGFSPPILPIISGLIAFQLLSKNEKKDYRVIFFFIFGIMIQLIWWTTEGRRPMTIISIISFLTFFSIYFKGYLTAKRVALVLAAGVAGVVLVYFAWQSYFLLRIATSESRGLENLGLFDLDRAREIAASVDVGQTFADNIVRRPFSILISLVFVRELSSGFLWGWNAVSQFLHSMPAFLFQDKFATVGPVQEALWVSALGMPPDDYTNTIFLESYMDFGFLGFSIYLLSMVAICTFLKKICRKIGRPELMAFNYFITVFVVMNIETSPNTFFVYIRSVFFISMIYFAMEFIGLLGRSKRTRKMPRP